jgi:hypothetical protein
LYEHYGYSVRDIGRLFIMGFGSSAVFGTVAGAMADRRCEQQLQLLRCVSQRVDATCFSKSQTDRLAAFKGYMYSSISCQTGVVGCKRFNGVAQQGRHAGLNLAQQLRQCQAFERGLLEPMQLHQLQQNSRRSSAA